MIRFAPASTARRSTNMDAIAVVTTPETAVAGSPALMVSKVSGFHSRPMFFLMRSMTSVAEMGALAVTPPVSAKGAATAETARAPNSLLERGVRVRSSARDFFGVAIETTVYSMFLTGGLGDRGRRGPGRGQRGSVWPPWRNSARLRGLMSESSRTRVRHLSEPERHQRHRDRRSVRHRRGDRPRICGAGLAGRLPRFRCRARERRSRRSCGRRRRWCDSSRAISATSTP